MDKMKTRAVDNSHVNRNTTTTPPQEGRRDYSPKKKKIRKNKKKAKRDARSGTNVYVQFIRSPQKTPRPKSRARGISQSVESNFSTEYKRLHETLRLLFSPSFLLLRFAASVGILVARAAVYYYFSSLLLYFCFCFVFMIDLLFRREAQRSGGNTTAQGGQGSD